MKLARPFNYTLRTLTPNNSRVTVGIGVSFYPIADPFISVSFQWSLYNYTVPKYLTDVYLQLGGLTSECAANEKHYLGVEYLRERVQLESAELYYTSKLLGIPSLNILPELFPYILFDLIKPRFMNVEGVIEIFNILEDKRVFI